MDEMAGPCILQSHDTGIHLRKMNFQYDYSVVLAKHIIERTCNSGETSNTFELMVVAIYD